MFYRHWSGDVIKWNGIEIAALKRASPFKELLD